MCLKPMLVSHFLCLRKEKKNLRSPIYHSGDINEKYTLHFIHFRLISSTQFKSHLFKAIQQKPSTGTPRVRSESSPTICVQDWQVESHETYCSTQQNGVGPHCISSFRSPYAKSGRPHNNTAVFSVANLEKPRKGQITLCQVARRKCILSGEAQFTANRNSGDWLGSFVVAYFIYIVLDCRSHARRLVEIQKQNPTQIIRTENHGSLKCTTWTQCQGKN